MAETNGKASRFAKWIDDVGAPEIAKKLQVGVRVVYAWRSKALGGNGYRPDPSRLGAILTLAAGRITAADVFPAEYVAGVQALADQMSGKKKGASK